MKKFLLLTSVASTTDDGDLFNSGAIVIGDYDTIDEAMDAAERDLNDEAYDCAANVCEAYNGDEYDEKIEDYVNDYIRYKNKRVKFDGELQNVGDELVILMNEYGSNWQDNRVYTLVRIK